MRILTPSFVAKWKGRIINIHPSLLPNFPGANAHRDVIKAGVKLSGCTVHLVDSGVDTGMILEQIEVEVLPEETIQSLQNKIKKIEHELYPKVLDSLSKGLYHSIS
jgi:folate-dependent phosphoribosylglycinamide formyltransferase PurN